MPALAAVDKPESETGTFDVGAFVVVDAGVPVVGVEVVLGEDWLLVDEGLGTSNGPRLVVGGGPASMINELPAFGAFGKFTDVISAAGGVLEATCCG